MSFLTGTNCELIYANLNAGTAKTTFTTEVAINDTAGMGVQATLPPSFWLPTPGQAGRGIHIKAQGIFSTTVTPTYTFGVRLGAVNNVTTAQVLASAALTTGSGITNQPWLFEGDVILTIMGAAGGNSTARGQGWFWSPGIASPFMAGLGASGSLTAPTVATVDTSITNFINFNVACSASSASNSVTLQQLMVWGLN